MEEEAMSNLSKERRERMLQYLEILKEQHNDDDSIIAINEIEGALREKKYGLVWEQHSEEVDEKLKEFIPVLIADEERRLCKNENLPWNFIVEGDNLQALYLLEKTHKGKVDCIYIDPPYNSGARDWKYNNDYVDDNDSYRHSKWLSMMKSRLEIAKHLLNSNNSVLIVTIDEKEYLHLGCLLEELFPEARIQMVSSLINRHGTSRANEFSRTNEFIFFVMIGDYEINSIDSAAYLSEGSGLHWHTLRRSTASNIRDEQHPNQFYPIYVDIETGRVKKVGESLPMDVEITSVESLPNCETVFPLRDDGTEMMWSIVRDKFIDYLEKGYARVTRHTPKKPQKFVIQYLQSGVIKDIENGNIEIVGHEPDGSVIGIYKVGKASIPSTLWTYDSHDARDYGTKILKNVIGEPRFDFPKSLYAVKDSLKLFVANKPNATIVDFFAGSGTTLHAVNLLNAEDGGCRKCIMVTNNEVSEAEEKELSEMGLKAGDKEWEQYGIAQYVTWPRTVCSIEGHDVFGKPLKGNYFGSDYPLAKGFDANVKYFKCDWTPRRPEEYLLSNALLIHVKELIELYTAEEIDGIKNVILYSKSDYKRIFENPELEQQVERVWVNENIIFNASEMRKLSAKGFRYIPRVFFGQELKEVGEYV